MQNKREKYNKEQTENKTKNKMAELIRNQLY